MSAGHGTIVVQMILIGLIVVIAYIIAARREKSAPVDDIGVFWLIIFALYTILPPLFWLIQGGMYISPFSGRLLYLQPSTAEVISLLNIALAYAYSFGVVYLLIRRRVPRLIPNQFPRISYPKMIGALLIVLVAKVVVLLMNVSGMLPNADSYIEQYKVIQQLPLVLRQSLKILTAIGTVASLVLVIAILQRWPRYRWWLFIFIALILFSFDPHAGRSALATGLLAVVIGWHVLVKRISSFLWLTGGVVSLVLFLIAGLWRGEVHIRNRNLLSRNNPGVGEFDALWGNTVQMLQEKNSGKLHVPFNVRFGEFWEFVPSQLLPFEKSSLSIWFVENYHRNFQLKGGGWAFGALSQAVIGNGIMEAILRGVLLGLIAGWLMKWHRSQPGAWWHLPVYIHVVIFSFLSIRESTFQQVGSFIQTVIPALILIAILGAIIKKRERKMQAAF